MSLPDPTKWKMRSVHMWDFSLRRDPPTELYFLQWVHTSEHSHLGCSIQQLSCNQIQPPMQRHFPCTLQLGSKRIAQKPGKNTAGKCFSFAQSISHDTIPTCTSAKALPPKMTSGPPTSESQGPPPLIVVAHN